MIVSMIRMMLMLRVMMELQRVIGNGVRNRGERDAGNAKVVRRLLMMMQMKVQGLLAGR